MDDLLDAVASSMRDTAAELIEPRFGRLATGDFEEKSPGEIVTVADREAEQRLTAQLTGLLPGVPVVGEEASTADPSQLALLTAERAWLIDPLDGTANFMAGSPDWAVMIALLERGEPVASWIFRPMEQLMYVASRGDGAESNRQPFRTHRRGAELSELRGAVLTRFLDRETAAVVNRNRHRFAAITDGHRCAGVEYPAVISGDSDFALFWRTLPWDHAPGVLLAQESGAIALRPDGTRYAPADSRFGLLVAADDETWALARTILT